jgi:hypothetical protein
MLSLSVNAKPDELTLAAKPLIYRWLRISFS